MKRLRMSDKERVDIVNAYTIGLVPMIALAKQYGLTRQGIHKLLKHAGVDTSKQAANIPVSCTCCGIEFTKLRCQVRKQKHVFCSEVCYFAWLHHGNGDPLVMHRTSARHARTIVGEYFALKPGYIVHHEDRNQFNNNLWNLRVFANQGDHVRYHRDCFVPILWDGSNYSTRT
jgi:hypothetical protein